MTWQPKDELASAVALEVLIHGPLGRAELARRLGLAPATLTRISTELIASGLLAALNTICDIRSAEHVDLPATTALGSLVRYATDPATCPYQPMHVNFGIIAPLGRGRLGKRERYGAYADRAARDMDTYLASRPDLFGRAR